MENKQSKKGILIGLFSGIFLLSILAPIVLGPIPASARSAPLMHSGMVLKPHPLATHFHGVSITSLQEYSPYINMMPMLIFSVGLILLIVFGVRQRQGGRV